VKRLLTRLEKTGELIVKRKRGTKNRYKLNTDLFVKGVTDRLVAPDDTSDIQGTKVGEVVTSRVLSSDIAMAYEPSITTNKEQPPLSDVPSEDEQQRRAMFGKVADICGLDMKLKASRIGKTVKNLINAGYTLEDLERFGKEIWLYDWRWNKHRQRPSLAVLEEEIGKLRAEPLDIPSIVEPARYGVERSMQAMDNVMARIQEQQDEREESSDRLIANQEVIRSLSQSNRF
jgi:hypothetical protein